MGTRAKLVFRNTTWSALSQLTFVAIKFITIPLVLNLYGKEKYGIIVIVAAFGGFLQLLTSGLPAGIVRHAAQWIAQGNTAMLQKGARTALSLFLLIGLVNLTCLALVAAFGSGLFNFPPEHIEAIKVMLVAVAFAGMVASYFSVADQLLSAHEDVAWLSRMIALPALLELAWIFIAGRNGYPFHVFFFGQLLTTVAPIPIKLLRLRRHLSLRKYFIPGMYWKDCSGMFRFSAGLFGIAMMQNAVNQLRPIILGMRAATGVAAAAEFRILFQVTQVIYLMKGWFTDPILPTVTKAVARGDHAFVERTAYKLTRVAWIITVIPVVMIAVCSREILEVYIRDHGAGLHFWLSFWMLAFIGSYLGPIYSVLLAKGLLRPLVKFTALTTVIAVALYWILAPTLNVGATVVGNVFFSIAHIVFYHAYLLRKLGLSARRLFVEAFVPPFIAACFAGGGAWAVLTATANHGALIRLVAGGATGVALYAGLILLFVMKPSEIRGYIEMLRNKAPETAMPTTNA